jgi:hypothetical protein
VQIGDDNERKVDRGHRKKECSKLLWCEREGRAGRGKATNENVLLSAECEYVAIRNV